MISGGVGGRWGIVSSQLKKNLHSWEQLWIKYKKRKQNNRVQKEYYPCEPEIEQKPGVACRDRLCRLVGLKVLR